MVPQSDLPHVRSAKAQQYKSEFLETMLGVTAAAAESEYCSSGSVFEYLSEQDNIIGLGFGLKVTDGQVITDQEALRVYVREKSKRSSLAERYVIPASVNGLPTDVVPLEDLVAAVRPQPCGVSIGHHAITAGTLGCLVRRANDEDGVYILSNNHVLADCDRAVLARFGIEIL